MKLGKIEISQEDYDFIKAFISEYAPNEEKMESLYGDLDYLKDQEENDEYLKLKAVSNIYSFFAVQLVSVEADYIVLPKETDEIPEVSATCDELYNILNRMEDSNVRNTLSLLTSECDVFDSLYKCIKNQDFLHFRETIYSHNIDIRTAYGWAIVCQISNNPRILSSSCSDEIFQFWYPGFTIQRLSELGNKNVLQEEEKDYVSAFLFKALIYIIFTVYNTPYSNTWEKIVFFRRNAPHFFCLIKNIQADFASTLVSYLENIDLFTDYLFHSYKKSTEGVLPNLTEHEVKAETDNSVEQVQCGGDPDLFKKRLQNKRHQKIVISQFLVGWFDILDNSKDLNYYISAIFFGSDGGNLLSPALRYKKAKWELVCFVSYLYKENVPRNVWEHLNKYICDKNGNSLFNDKNPSSAASSEKKQQVKRNIIKYIQDHINRPLSKEEKEDIGDE